MYEVICADVLEWAESYDGPKFHAVLCDAPYHLTTITKRFGKEGSAQAKYGNDGAFQRVSGGFMGQEWDGSMVSFQPETWAAIGQHLYPGAFLMTFAGSRTFHRIACAIEDAGFIIHPMIGWINGQGFPKATRIDTQVDKSIGRINQDVIALKEQLIELFNASGKTRKQIDEECSFRATNYLTLPAEDKRPDPWVNILPTQEKWQVIKKVIGNGDAIDEELDKWFEEAERLIVGQQTKARKTDSKVPLPTSGNTEYQTWDVTIPATDVAQTWVSHRYGLQALKPCLEPICVAQLPYDGRPVDCITETGAGSLWIDGGRIGTEQTTTTVKDLSQAHGNQFGKTGIEYPKIGEQLNKPGRWPANVTLGHHVECTNDCHPECPIRQLDEEVGQSKAGIAIRHNIGVSGKGWVHNGFSNTKDDIGYDDKDGPSRFYFNSDWSYEIAERLANLSLPMKYCPKAGRKERDAGLNSERSSHPTMKPIKLTTWLATLLLPPPAYAPRRILIPFAGVMSEGIGAILAGWEEVIGIELSQDYCAIAEARLAYWSAQPQQRKLL
jgi:DNA modification methylase